MESIACFLADDHEACDQLFAEAEEAIARGNWEAAADAHGAFARAIDRHFAMEETVLFPDFDTAAGSSSGPTQVMRHEHQQMRELLHRLEQSVSSGDTEAYLGDAETLLILMQQHNAKEERILYPMSDQLLSGQRLELIRRMQSMER